MKRNLVWAAALALTACSSLSFHTNLDPGNFTEYYKPSRVEVLQGEAELDRRPYVSLGQVAGLACQAGERDYIATEADARTDARRKAADLGANAILFTRCVRINDTPACRVSVTCYGDALRADER